MILLLIIEQIETDISFGGMANYIVHITFWKQGDIYQFDNAATLKRDTKYYSLFIFIDIHVQHLIIN